jgi:hypothetical protein
MTAKNAGVFAAGPQGFLNSQDLSVQSFEEAKFFLCVHLAVGTSSVSLGTTVPLFLQFP